jgi:mono/diheme cytochrome c family protein
MKAKKSGKLLRLLLCFAWALALLSAGVDQDLHAQDDLSRRAFNILNQNCFACHGAAKTSGLDLRTGDSILTGGDRGAVLIPSDANGSRLFQFVSHREKPAMPPGKKLSEPEIETLRQWIEAGAPFGAFEDAAAPERNNESKEIPDYPITDEERKFWAFQPLRPVTPPGVDGNRNPIDSFLNAAMKARDIRPSPKADRRTLIRRAYLDLTGLPPEPEEVESFAADRSEDSWEKLIDRLLASPHYGERWARHWLDLVRYADSGGFEFDRDRPEAWRYRDYVIQSLNSDKPYDRFIKEQLAGDEYWPESAEARIATGFLRLGPEGEGGGERVRQDALDDLITTTSLTFMGLMVGCARCHDHKFDPISQRDFYRMQAVFVPVKPLNYPLVDAAAVSAHRAETRRIDQLETPLKRAKTELEAPYLKQLVDAAVGRLPDYLQAAWRTPEEKRTPGQRLNVRQIEKTLKDDPLSARITAEHILTVMPEADRIKHRELTEKIAALEKHKPGPYPTARAVAEDGRIPRASFFLHRGSPEAKGPAVTPGVLSVISGKDYEFPAPPSAAKSSWRRRTLAEWLVSRDHPLTARVMVNRIWQHHFGEGIVRTPSNFGKLGDLPSHPELLDWLALQFIERGWSIKQMHRLMMTSEAYQTASDDIRPNIAIDPENRLFWRMPRLRLEAEVIRDKVLAVAGNLDRTMGGPCVFPYIDPKLFQSSTKRTWPGKPDDDPSTWRRSIYVFSKRSIRYPLFELFDQPNLINSCDRRNRATIAPQALVLMNNNFIHYQARRFAERVRKEAGDDLRAQVERAFRLALSRKPRGSEAASAIEYVTTTRDGLAEFCRVLFNLNEFVYRQ